MKIIRRRVATLLILPLLALALFACETTTTPITGYFETPQTAYDAAQSTLVYGQNQLEELSHQATVVGLMMDQAANAAQQATLDNNQREMMELAYQATAVSLNMAQAAATQQFITEQTQMAENAMSTAQSQAATATYSAYILNVTHTAQAQAILDIHAAQTAQANATQVAYSLTATPWAAIQAEIVRAQNEAERRALWGEFVVTPLKLILLTLVAILLIVGGVMAYRRLMPVLELRLRTISRHNDSTMLLMDGMIVDPDPPHRLPSDDTPHVEIVGPSEPSVVNWIAEAEQKLRSNGRIQP
jgi:Tfp pilus assembly protein PilX